MDYADAVLVVSEGGPVLMMIPNGTACVGFASEELARRYASYFGLDAKGMSFAAIRSVVSSWSEEQKKNLPVVFFRSTEDLARLAKERGSFPYSDFSVPSHEFEK